MPAAAAALWALPAAGQLGEPAPEPVQPKVHLDVDALLSSDQVLPDQVQGPVWQVAPQPGRMLIQLPLVVEPVDEDAELSRPPIDVRGGRFVAWRVPTPGDQTGGSRRSMNFNQPDFGPDDFGMPGRRNSPTVGSTGGVPDNAPRLAREITVHPDGTITWELDRSIPGGEIAGSGNDYALRLRPDLLQEQRPERPERAQRNEEGGDLSAFRAQQIEQQRQFREEMEAYRELGTRIRELPGEFTTTMPPQLWAVFEVNQSLPTLQLEGGDPLPWSISLTAFRSMRETASQRSRGDRLSFEDMNRISAMGAALNDDHPLTIALVARTIAASGMVQAMQPNDPLFGLVRTLLQKADPETRTALIGELVAAPPSPAIDRLLESATELMNPEQKLMAIQRALGEGRSAAQLEEAIAVVNRALADPHGANPGKVLGQLARAAGPNADDETLGLLTTGVQFDLVPADRMEQTILGVMRAAVSSPVAGSWLNHRLLGSDDAKVVDKTLTQLARAEVAVPQEPQQQGRRGRRSRNAPPDFFDEYAQFDQYGPQGYGQNAEAADDTPELTEDGRPLLRGRIPLSSADHALIRLLESNNEQQRDLAWQALPKFTLENGNRYGRGRNNGDPAAQLTPAQRIVQAAFKQKPTPASLPTFLASLRDPNESTEMLAATTIYASPDVAAEAAKTLYGSDRNIASAMEKMRPEERGIFAQRMYEALEGKAPDVAGLLRDPERRSSIASWFAQRVAQGSLPDPGVYSQQFREEELLNLAASTDQELSRAAIAAMVHSVGGDQEAVESVVNRFAQQGDRSTSALQKVWGPVKQDIYQRKLASASGAYRVRLEIGGRSLNLGGNEAGYGEPGYGPDYGPEFGGDFPGEYSPPRGRSQRSRPADYGPGILGPQGAPTTGNSKGSTTGGEVVSLGIMNLEADAQGIRIANDAITLTVPETHLAIRIAQPNQLKNFDKPELADLPLSNVYEPLDLFPQDDGSWAGQVQLSNGQSLAMFLEPVDQQQ